MESAFRLWQPERWPDAAFVHRVEPVKWDYFAARVRPLADSMSEQLWESLFAGVEHPFHFKRARSWMGQIFRRVCAVPSDTNPGQTTVESLVAELGWEPTALSYSVFEQHGIYEIAWADWLDCYRRKWLPLDTLVVCSAPSPRVAMFWESFGPYYAKRGNRALGVY